VRKKYLHYMDSLDVDCGAKVGFFDFVSSGTCQKALANIAPWRLFGLYFIAVNHEADYKRDTEIDAMFGMLNVFVKSYHVMENYFFLENVLASFEPTLSGFDDDGKPMFIKESRSPLQLERLAEIHRGITEYAGASAVTLDALNKVDLNVPDLIFSFIDEKYCVIDAGCFSDEVLRDEFCNRKFVFKGE
jgi:hypothetical protein